jgi:hypothetical protein
MPWAPSHPTLLALFAGVVAVAYFVTHRMLGHDRREPPLAPQSVPPVGHMVGMSRSKFNYYVDLRYGHNMSSSVNNLY